DKSNRGQIDAAYNLVRRTGKKRIGVLGLSFKAGTDDMRESPIVTLIETLIGKGYKVAIHDEEVAIAKLIGANKRYIDEAIPHIPSLMMPSPAEVIEASEVLVVGRNDPVVQEALITNGDSKVLIDLVRLRPEVRNSSPHYEGICW